MRLDLRKHWVPLTVALVQSVRYLRLLRMPELQLIDHIPDDAFFYLQTARTFALTDRWSFDGTAPASGFHLLWGYLLAALFRLRPTLTLHGVVVIGGLFQLAAVILAAALITHTATRLFGARAAIGTGIIVLSATSLSMGLALMEAPFVMLIGALTLELLTRPRITTKPAWLLALGLTGMAIRSDYGLLPLGLTLMWAALYLRHKRSPGAPSQSASSIEVGLIPTHPNPAKNLRAALTTLTGALLASALLALHTHWISGNYIQSSVREKLWWSQVQGLSILPALSVIERFFYLAANGYWSHQRVLQTSDLLSQIIPIVLLAGALALAWQLRRNLAAPIIAGMILIVALYIAFYRYNCADLQFWYIAPFQGPVALLAGAAAAWFYPRIRWLTVATALILCGTGIVMSFHPTYPFQRAYYQSGLYLHQHPELSPAASWNCGMMGFFAATGSKGQAGLTNLDGLVNDDILVHAKAGTLARYIGQRHIKTIIDSRIMLGRTMRRRGGFDDGKLQSCLIVEDHFGTNARDPDDDMRLVVWHVLPNCPGLQ